jgi:hypothetical protein
MTDYVVPPVDYLRAALDGFTLAALPAELFPTVSVKSARGPDARIRRLQTSAGP